VFLLAGDCQGRNGEHVVGTLVIDLDTARRFGSYPVVSFDQDVNRAPKYEVNAL
jgi:hypothetical protein